jgi:hypothetical protein
MHSILFVHLFEKMSTTSELFMFLCFACGILLTLHNGIRAATVQCVDACAHFIMFEEILQVRGNLVSIFSLQENFVYGFKV